MTAAFRLNNQTGSLVKISDVGDEVQASSFIDVPNYDRHKYADSIDIDPLVNGGTLVVEHPLGTLLNAFDGLCLIHEETYFHTSEVDTPSVAVVTERTKVVRYIGPPWMVTNPAPGYTYVELNLSNTAEGKEATYQFFNNGSNIQNKWLDHEGSNIPSDMTPGVVSANSKVRAITYSNDRDNTDIDIQIYRNGITPGDMIFAWQLRDCRLAYKTDFDGSLPFNRGDTVRMFAKKVVGGPGGQNPTKAVIKLTLINTDDIKAEGCEPTDNPPITEI